MLFIVIEALVILLVLVGIFMLIWSGMKLHNKRHRYLIAGIASISLISVSMIVLSISRHQDSIVIGFLYACTIFSVAILVGRFRAISNTALQHETYFDALLNGSKQGIVIVSNAGKVIMANKRTQQILNCTQKDLLNLKIQTLMSRRHNEPSYYLNYDRHIPDFTGMKRDGYQIPFEINSHAFTFEKEQYTMLFLQDIEPHQQTTRELKWQRNFSETLWNEVPVFLLILSENGTITSINNYGKRMLGIEDGQKKLDWFNFIPNNFRTVAAQFFIEHSLKGDGFTCPVFGASNTEYFFRWQRTCVESVAEGFTYIYSGSDVTAANSETKFIDAALDDLTKLNTELELRIAQRTQELKEINDKLHAQISEKKYIEIELLNNQRLYSMLAHNFPNGLIGVLNRDLRYVLVDGKELERTKVKQDELIGHKVFESYQDFTDLHEARLKRAFEGEYVSFDIALAGSLYNLVSVALPDIHSGQVNEILIIISNTTQWKKLEDDLHRAIEQEKELVELKSRFVTMASHEFRTPLGTILSSVFLLERYNDSGYEEKRTIHINRIKNTVNNLTEMLNDFLSLGKLEEGKVQVSARHTNVEGSIRELITEMRSAKRSGQKIEYIHRGSSDTAMVDMHLLRNILMNLISNAIKYSPVNGIITVVSELTQNQLLISVEDQGLGIPEEEKSHIFERFFRSRNTVNIEGTGLGLHIVKKYVELMHGSIDFISTEKGTTFKVLIPLE